MVALFNFCAAFGFPELNRYIMLSAKLYFFPIAGFHLSSQPSPNMGIRHNCVPRSAKFMVIVSHLYRSLLVRVEFFASIMDLAEDIAEEDLNTPSFNIPVLSEYAKALDKQVKRRYLEKISVVGVEPVSIPSVQFDP